jgi:tetratricopeptide (TPR) repeat protein/DNA-binding winged helix-turn-helix (wHTH) protein
LPLVLAEVEFALLGPLEVRRGGVELPVTPGRQRALLATLCLNGGHVVAVDELIQVLWGEEPPPSVRVSLQIHVKRLRTALGDTDRRLIATRRRGYLINVEPGALDVTRFELKLAAARAAAGDRSWATVSQRACAALALWRGEPLVDTGSQVLVSREAPRLAELRRQAMELSQEADRRLAAGSGAPESGRVIPRELPGTAAHFTGRAGELATLTKLAAPGGGPAAGTMVISAIGGSAGVGKTTLAVCWAHQAAGRFPDGQLYVNLRGYDPDQPMPPADALAQFLRALGVPGPDIPAEAGERAARYRSLLAGRRMLVLLDNASSEEQVRPLLPGTASCLVLVTSRDSLAGLVAREGGSRLDLDLLPAADANALLTTLIGDRAAADPEATARLVESCARLPLALRVAAELAAARPGATLASLAVELADEQRRLDLLDAGGDPRTAVRAVFSWSYRHLDHDAARMFRLLGLNPGPDFDGYAAAALAGTTLARAGDLITRLARTHLVQPAGPGRYVQHDLLRAYARELATGEDGLDAGRAALTRLFDHYLGTTAAAMNTLYPGEHRRRPPVPPAATPGPPVGSESEARTWLDGHRATLVTVVGHTAGHGWPGHATRLARTLHSDLEYRGHFLEAISVHSHARRAALQAGDQDAEADALWALSGIALLQGRYREATDAAQQALARYRETGDRNGAALVLHNLGIIAFTQGRYPEATGHLRQAMEMHAESGDLDSAAGALNDLGGVELRLGRFEEATDHLQRSLSLFRATGNRLCEAYPLMSLGATKLQRGRYQEASTDLQQALALSQAAGDRIGEASAKIQLARVDLRTGRHQQAGDRIRSAMTVYREVGEQSAEAESLNLLGELGLATGAIAEAQHQYAAALTLASSLGERYEQARALAGLGHVSQALGDPARAREHWQDALSRYGALGTPEAEELRAKLASQDRGTRTR